MVSPRPYLLSKSDGEINSVVSNSRPFSIISISDFNVLFFHALNFQLLDSLFHIICLANSLFLNFKFSKFSIVTL